MLIIQLITKINLYPEGQHFDSFRSTGVRFRDTVTDGKFKMAAGDHLEYIFMLIIQLSTKINLYPEGPNFDSFRSTGVRFRDIVKDGKSKMVAILSIFSC